MPAFDAQTFYNQLAKAPAPKDIEDMTAEEWEEHLQELRLEDSGILNPDPAPVRE